MHVVVCEPIGTTRPPGAARAIMLMTGTGSDPDSPDVETPARETILLVDDEDVVRRLLVRALRAGGYQVVEASEASEAFAALQAPGQHIDLIVSDLVMPGLGGAEFAQRAAAAFPGLRILLMSGLGEEHIVSQLPEASRGGFLDKPFTPDQLLRAVRAALDAPRD